jgi:hypothetical protein
MSQPEYFPIVLVPQPLESALMYRVMPKPFDKPAPVAPQPPDLSKLVTKQGKLAQTFGLGGLADRLNQTAVREAEAVYEREKAKYISTSSRSGKPNEPVMSGNKPN